MRLFRMATVVLCVPAMSIVNPHRGAAQSTPLADWTHYLEYQTRDGTMWWTSNAQYQQEDGGIDSYATRFEMLPGGLAARGCLWGEANGSTVGPFWEFFMAWDVREGKGLVYQIAPSGVSGIGYWWIEEDGVEMADQTYRNPDGTTNRVGHRSRVIDDDTNEGGSLNWTNGEWVPQRTYRWERRPGAGAPC